MTNEDPRPDGPADLARVCPECGELVPFVEWPGEGTCPSCASATRSRSTRRRWAG